MSNAQGLRFETLQLRIPVNSPIPQQNPVLYRFIKPHRMFLTMPPIPRAVICVVKFGNIYTRLYEPYYGCSRKALGCA